MTQRVVLACDKCGRETPGTAKHILALDGREREIDLCADDLKPVTRLLEKARPANGRAGKPAGRQEGANGLSAEERKAVRQWAAANPVQVNGKPWQAASTGKIPAVVVWAYQEAKR